MAFVDRKTKRSELRQKQENSLISREQVINRKSDPDRFFEYEAAVVLDVISNEDHPLFKLNGGPKIDVDNFPGKPLSDDIDYSWIGRALIRMVKSDQGKGIETLSWAIPLNGCSGEYPLKNEAVYVVTYLGQLYYGKINTRNFINNNADFRYEKKYGLNQGLPKDGPISYTRNPDIEDTRGDFNGSLGNYFKANDGVRAVKRYEGDTVIESRFGQSIRFSSYVGNPLMDVGDPTYKTYFNGGGNPMILIRNRQRDISQNSTEKNVGGSITEDINSDGSSIQITSGLTISNWNTNTIITKPFEVGIGKYTSNFSPKNSTSFKYPILNGDQIIAQSDRIILSARKNELMAFSKKRMAFATDSEFTINSEDQIVITSNNSTHINSPLIFLGDYGVGEEPIMLGQSTAQWLYQLIDWLKVHTHIYNHTHPKVGGPTPNKTQVTPELAELINLQSKIPQLLSDRVYTVGRNTLPTNRLNQTGNPPSIIPVRMASRNYKTSKI